ACSTGQEPYTAAMIIREHFPDLENWTCKIRATDLARKVIDRASAGTYSQLEINRGMPAAMLLKYFRRERIEWVIRDDIRKMVEFSEFNLTRPWPSMPAMDLIFLRNVLIYFDVATKQRILRATRDQLKPDGFMLLGNAETTLGIDEGFERLPGDRSGWHRLASEEIMGQVELVAEDIYQLAQGIWETLFADHLEVAGEELAEPSGFISGCIQITGAWEGVVALR